MQWLLANGVNQVTEVDPAGVASLFKKVDRSLETASAQVGE